MEIHHPRDEKDVEAIVRAAVLGAQPLAIVGHGSKSGVGALMEPHASLDLSALSGIHGYEPHELILTLHAGTPLGEVMQLLAANHQELPFEPMDVSVLMGGNGMGTIGGAVACGWSGPRRIKAGAARDHVLGISAVSGRGEAFKAGGRVVKNVTGYDLAKLMAGSWGTLAVMTQLTLKVLPNSETETTLALTGLGEDEAARALIAALNSACDVSGAAFWPSALASRAPWHAGSGSLTMLRLEGIASSVDHRAKALVDRLKGFGEVAHCDGDTSRQLWRAVRDVTPFAHQGPAGEHAVWRVVTPPAAGLALGRDLTRAVGADYLADWGGGLIWLAVEEGADAQMAQVHAIAARHGGHAALVRASDPVRRLAASLMPRDGALEALNRRIKAGFDPLDILNRGRMGRASGEKQA